MGKEKDYFLENLAMLFSASINILEALDALKEETRSRKMRRVLGAVREDVDAGYALSKALAHTKMFPDHVISLLEIGEESGRLPENLQVVAEERAKDREFKSKLRSAMAYPMIVLTLTVVIGVGVAWFILPRLATVFEQLEVELPVITEALIALGDFLGLYGLYAVPLFLIAVFGFFYFLFFFRYTKFIGERILFALPGAKRLLQQVEIARFGFMMGNLLEAGLPLVPALHSVRNAASFYLYKHFYTNLAESIEEGNTFAASFEGNRRLRRLFPSTAIQMITAAEKSGALPRTFRRLGEIYGAKSDNTVKNIAVVLEPIMLIVVWLGVLAVAVAIILPIYSLIGGFNP